MNNTKTPNGASNEDKLTPEEEKTLLSSEKIKQAELVIVSEKEVDEKAVATVDITAATIIKAPGRGEHGYLSGEEQGSPIKVEQAAEAMRGNGTIIVVKDGQAVVPNELDKNDSQKAGDKRRAIRTSAEEKWERNESLAQEEQQSESTHKDVDETR